MPHHKYESIVHKTPTGVYYDKWIEHSHADVEYVIQLEEEEKARRLEDKDGEKQRQHAAQLASEIVTESVRPVWFGRGSLFVLKLLTAMRKGGNNLLRSSQIRTMEIVDKLNEITQKGKTSLDEVTQKSKASFNEITQKTQAKVDIANQKIHDSLVGNKQKIQERSRSAKLKLEESSHDLKLKVDDTLGAAHEKIQNATEFANEKIEKIGGAVSGVVGIITSAGANLIEKLKEKWANLTTNTNLAFAVIEEENERAYRLNSDIETFAIFNALLLSSLIKELKPEFYRPDFEPTRKYSTRLLEDIERRRRMIEDLFDKKGIENAKTISFLIDEKFAAKAVEELPLPKKEIVEPIHISLVPMGATM